MASTILRKATSLFSKLPTVAVFGDAAPKSEAFVPIPEVSGVARDEDVLFLTETAAVHAETFGVRSLVFL